MTVNLVKGQKISLKKDSGQVLEKVVMGLGWDPAKAGTSIDLDASCVLFDENKKALDSVWFGQLKSKDGSVVHTGDNLTGEGEGDDERIIVDLTKVPPEAKYLAFTVNSFRGQTFNEVANAFCRLVDANGNLEVARHTLSGGGKHTAMIMAKVYRHGDEWKMAALGDPAEGRTVEDLIPAIAEVL
ncbi:MAG: TerD family protein [Deltaproteobacteria bacterium]|jgi:tellurium resistance protein TerZ|nr:TerD family protein [Deltaproteobacteria bacterium]